jgi:hypothetical protein
MRQKIPTVHPHDRAGDTNLRVISCRALSKRRKITLGFADCEMLCATGELVVTPEKLAAMFEDIWPHLDERQRRLLMGAHAGAGPWRDPAGGRGGGGCRGDDVAGARELAAGAEPLGRARREGGAAGRCPRLIRAGPIADQEAGAHRLSLRTMAVP